MSPNVITNGGVDGGTTGWGFYPDNSGITVIVSGDTLLAEADGDTVLFAASVGDSALSIPELGTAGTENNAFFTYSGADALPVGTQFIASAHVHPGLSVTTGRAILFAKYFTSGYALVGMDSVGSNVGDLSVAWNPMEIFANVPAGTEITQVGVMYVSGGGTGVIYLDELKISSVGNKLLM